MMFRTRLLLIFTLTLVAAVLLKLILKQACLQLTIAAQSSDE